MKTNSEFQNILNLYEPQATRVRWHAINETGGGSSRMQSYSSLMHAEDHEDGRDAISAI